MSRNRHFPERGNLPDRAIYDKIARLQTISVQVQDALLARAGGSVEVLTRQAQVLLAVKYFELGLLNFGQAAVMCAMERADFLTAAKQCGAEVKEWDS